MHVQMHEPDVGHGHLAQAKRRIRSKHDAGPMALSTVASHHAAARGARQGAPAQLPQMIKDFSGVVPDPLRARHPGGSAVFTGWGYHKTANTCAQTAIIATNSAIDVMAAASSTSARNIGIGLIQQNV